MIHQMFAVFDQAASMYLPPFPSIRVEVAERAFRDAVNRGEGDVAKYPEHFSLHHLGSWDDSTGVFVSERGGPRFILGALSVGRRPAGDPPAGHRPAGDGKVVVINGSDDHGA